MRRGIGTGLPSSAMTRKSWLFNGLFHESGGSAEIISLGIVAVVLTCFSLILGELLPRRIASVYPETIAVLMARPLQLLTRSAWWRPRHRNLFPLD